MRSFTEISFRLQQEATNLLLLWSGPTYSGKANASLGLPDGRAVAKALQGTEFAADVERLADSILRHEFPVFGSEINTGPEIQWRRDYVHRKESDKSYFKRVPYLDFEKVGDHKLVWELNRHQHLVLLAQAYLLTGRAEFVSEIEAQLLSWWQENPFQRGINWASALEVAFRTLSWLWVLHLVGTNLDEQVRTRLISSLYQHGLHLDANLSVYFSPNTHLLGEAVALFALGTLLPELPRAKKWAQRSRRIVLEQLRFQVKPDGSHFEQSSYYHVYALDFFLFFHVIAEESEQTAPVLRAMGEYLEALLGPHREISFWGDDDGGRLFHPYGQRNRFGRATLACCGLLLQRPDWIGTRRDRWEVSDWWLGPSDVEDAPEPVDQSQAPRTFADSGMVVLSCGDFHLQMDCGPFGFGGAGHSHSDSLAIVLRYRGKPVLVDPGTFTYISDARERNWHRGSSAHNTVRIDGQDQAFPVTPFRWSDKPEVRCNNLHEQNGDYLVDASCQYRGFRHSRRLLLRPSEVLILDEVDGPPGVHQLEQTWQLGPEADQVRFATSWPSKRQDSWFSAVYGSRQPSSCVVAVAEGELPLQLAAAISLDRMRSISVPEATTLLGRFAAGQA